MPAEFDAYPFEAGEGSFLTEFRWSEMFRWMRTDGVITRNPPELLPNVDLDVSPASGMSIQIAPGQAIIRGVFWLHRDSPYEMPIITNLDSYPRIDLVVLRCDFDVNTMYYDIVQGVPDPNPVAPVPEDDSETVTEIPLATVLVRPSTEAEDIIDADITDLRIRSVQANSGSSPLLEGDGIILTYIGDRIIISAGGGDGEDGSTHPLCSICRSANLTINNASTSVIQWDTIISDDDTMWDSATKVICTSTGWYQVLFNCTWEGNVSANGSVCAYIQKNSTRIGESRVMIVGDEDVSNNLTVLTYLTTGDEITVSLQNNSGLTLDAIGSGIYTPTLSVFKIRG